MGQIKLCDCTLSVGGAINEGYFARDAIEDYFSRIGESKIEYFSAGVLDIIPSGLDVATYESMESLRRSQFPGKGNRAAAITVAIGSQQPYAESLEPFQAEKTPEILRLVFQPEDLAQAAAYAAIGKKKGYRIWLQPRCGASLSAAEWQPIAQKAAALAPEALFLDDGFGWLDCDEFLAAARWLDEALSPNITLGVCIGNGKSQALETARAFFAQELRHAVIVDTSIGGMGSGGGVLPTEWAMEQLSAESYRVDVILELYSRTIFPNHRIHTWGPSPLSLIAAQARIDFRYIDFFREQMPVPAEDLAGILKELSPEKRNAYSRKEALHAAYLYERRKTSLAIVIPTCNRAASIDYLLGTTAWQARRYGIDFIIYDSSDNDKTETIVRHYQLEGYENVIYERYTGEFDGFSLDHKVIAACKQYCGQYNYLWPCRDGLVITLDACFQDIKCMLQKGLDLLVIDAAFRNKNKKSEKVYGEKDHVQFFLENTQRMTILGSTIYSCTFLEKALNECPLDEKTYGLWLPAAPMTMLAAKPLHVGCYIGYVFTYNPTGTANSFWNKAGTALEEWACRWSVIIDALPEVYNEAKADVKKMNMFDFHPFYLNSLLRMRSNGGLNLALVRKYQQYFPDVCDTPLWKFHLAALMPRFAAKLLVERSGSRAGRMLYRIYRTVFRVGEEA
ncbi:hypothetical protein [Oscillibacter sp.]|uniref:hypothetical protein n=1 Tax=Oscillibacter sp. TaxID=1945593 RepID=UPI0028972308|nr:hypothetical protein [Oscillibacter sp.]